MAVKDVVTQRIRRPHFTSGLPRRSYINSVLGVARNRANFGGVARSRGSQLETQGRGRGIRLYISFYIFDSLEEIVGGLRLGQPAK
jgi:hypothetical protein